MRTHRVEFVSYDGAYPNLCAGTLVLRLDGEEWKFPPHALESGGSVWFDDSWEEHIEDGGWSIEKWPSEWPDDAKRDAVDCVNENVPHGCCGGCV